MLCSQLEKIELEFDYLLGLSKTGGVMAAGLATALGSLENPKPWGLVQWAPEPTLPLELKENLDQRVLMVDNSLDSLRVFRVLGAFKGKNPSRIVGLIHFGKNGDELVFSSLVALGEFVLRLVAQCRQQYKPRIL